VKGNTAFYRVSGKFDGLWERGEIRRQPEHRAAARTATARTRRQKGAHPGGRKRKSG